MRKKYVISLVIAGAIAGVVGYWIGKRRRKKSVPDANINSVTKQKRALIVTSVASMVDQFIMPSIKLLIDMGYEVDVATNFEKGSTCPDERIEELIERLDNMCVDCYHIDFDRKVTDIRADLKAFKQLDEVVCGKVSPINSICHHCIESRNEYSFIHSHSPIGGVVGRVTGKRHGIKNIYTAHGFHFYGGAPKKNWLIFYPIEEALSQITDVLITINKEDYRRAKKKFKAKKTVYIPGIGIDVDKVQKVKIDRQAKRAGLGLKGGDVMLFSIGELNENKNHRVVVEALGMIDKSERSHLHYFIAGKDAGQRDELVGLAEDFGVNLHLLGYRTDIPELLKAADIFLLPSIREGLNVGLMEAMAGGLPCIVSDIRGNKDLVDEKGGYKDMPFNPYEWKNDIQIMNYNQKQMSKLGIYNRDKIKNFSIKTVNEKLKNQYGEL